MKLLGKDVANELIKDVEGFYFHSAKFKIKKQFGSSSRHPAAVVGKGDDKRIRLSIDFCDFPVTNLKDLFFVSIIICHEIAHYLNDHTSHLDKSNADFTALEVWADFFGARLFITSITFGSRMQKLIKKFTPIIEEDKILSAIGLAIKDMYEFIYLPTTDKRYPLALERVLIFNAGSTSFFYRLYNSLTPEFSIKVILTILKEAGLTDIVGKYESSKVNNLQLKNNISDMHKALQGNDDSITKGLKPCYYIFLTTNYFQTPSETKYNHLKLSDQIKNLGFEPNEIMAGHT
jgi:hypothetical protein